MQKHTKIYMEFFSFGIDDYISCEICGLRATDIHHIRYRSRLGKDSIMNLIGLCRSCHNKAHKELILPSRLTEYHISYIKIRGLSI